MLYILLSILAIVVAAFYFLYYGPKKKIERFAKNAQELGYKVKLLPFSFMNYYILKYYRLNEKSLKIFKEQFYNYDLIVGNFFTQLSIVVIHPQMVKDFFNQLNKLPKNPLSAQVYQQLNIGGLVFSEGETWKRKRRIISSVFHFDFLNDMIPVIEEQMNIQFKKIDEDIENGKTINLKNVLVRILSTVIVKSFFGAENMQDYMIQGKPYCEQYMAFLDEVASYASSVQHLLLGLNGYKYGLTKTSRDLKKKRQLLNSIAKQITLKQLEKINRKQITKKNLLVRLYQSQLLKQGSQSLDRYSIDQLIGEFMAFFAAGTDTTVNSINLALHYLSNHQNCIQKILQQLKSLNLQQNLTQVEKLKNMKWIQAVFNETIRLNGPVMTLLLRKATQDIKLGQLKLPKGTLATMMPLLNHYKKEYFYNPQEFIAERWIQDNKIQPYTYTPFGGGQRNCIGQYLARIQTKILISNIIEKYNFKAIYPIKMKASFVYSTEYGQFQMQLRKKQK